MNKKKFMALFLTAVCVFSMTACGDSGKQSEPSVNNDLSVESEQKAPEDENGDIDIMTPGEGKETNTEQNVQTPDAQDQDQTQKPQEKNPEPEKKPAEQKPAETQKPAEQKPAQTQKPAEQKPADLKATAKSFEGKSVSSLKAAVGSPNSSSYSPSCMGEGEDGELSYNGFTVYTYRENGSEKVMEVV